MKGRIFQVLAEILESLKRHPVRFMITAVGVTWSVFVLMVLLGLGRGIETGILSQLSHYSMNTLWLIGENSGGLSLDQPTQQIRFSSNHLSLIRSRFPVVLGLTPESRPILTSIAHQGYYGQHLLKGVSHYYFPMKGLDLEQGRFYNPREGRNQDLVAIIGSGVKELVFRRSNAVGQYLNVSGYHFQVVGVLKGGSLASQYEANVIFIPYQTLTGYFNHGETFPKVGVWLPDNHNASIMTRRLERFLFQQLDLDYQSGDGIYTISTQEQARAFHSVFSAIRYFLWAIGLSLIVGSIIGIGNTMLMSVNTRLDEIALRKAVGATPGSIAGLVVGETVMIVILAGLTGILSGLLFNKVLTLGLGHFMDDQHIAHFIHFRVEPTAIVLCLFLLTAAGILAGSIPAFKAAKLKPAAIFTGG